MKRSICIILVICAVISLNTIPIYASASETTDTLQLIDNPENYFYSFTPTVMPRLTELDSFLFTITGSSVTELLTSRLEGKYIEKESLSDTGYIYYEGTLTTTNGNTASAGLCTYNYLTGVSTAKHRTYFPSGEFTQSALIPVTELLSNTTYYAFIQGANTNGTSGDIRFWLFDWG